MHLINTSYTYTVVNRIEKMTSKVERSPTILKQLLTRGVAAEQPSRSGEAVKRCRTAEERSVEEENKKRRKEFVGTLVEAVSEDLALSGSLNLAVYEHCSDDLSAGTEGQVVIVTSKKVHYHEPVGYISRVRLVLKDSGKYCIQVKLPTLIVNIERYLFHAYHVLLWSSYMYIHLIA